MFEQAAGTEPRLLVPEDVRLGVWGRESFCPARVGVAPLGWHSPIQQAWPVPWQRLKLSLCVSVTCEQPGQGPGSFTRYVSQTLVLVTSMARDGHQGPVSAVGSTCGPGPPSLLCPGTVLPLWSKNWPQWRSEWPCLPPISVCSPSGVGTAVLACRMTDRWCSTPPQTPCMCPGEAGVGGRASVTLLRLAVWGYLCLPPAMGPRQDADAPRGWGWGSLPIITPELHGTGDCVARPVLLSGPVGPGPWQNACLPQTAPSAFLLGVGGPFLPRQPGPGPALHTPE